MTVFERPYLIDGLQYAQWTLRIFGQMRAAGVDAVHATVAYHGNYSEALECLDRWHERFEEHSSYLLHGLTAADLVRARSSGRTAIYLGFQNPSPIEDNLDLLYKWHEHGVRFMQLCYNNQSLLASGYSESTDSGITNMGREVVRAMNALGMVIDMSHAGERSAIEAIELSGRPVAISHANPRWWLNEPRNVPGYVIDALAQTNGILGLSCYPNHLVGGSDCTLEAFCRMMADAADRHGVDVLGLGSDLCQDRPSGTINWMRYGRWSSKAGMGPPIEVPPLPSWFQDNLGFENVRRGLERVGFTATETAAVMGENWRGFLSRVLSEDKQD